MYLLLHIKINNKIISNNKYKGFNYSIRGHPFQQFAIPLNIIDSFSLPISLFRWLIFNIVVKIEDVLLS